MIHILIENIGLNLDMIQPATSFSEITIKLHVLNRFPGLISRFIIRKISGVLKILKSNL